MSKPLVRCPACGSFEIKKNALGLPRCLSPVGTLIMGMVVCGWILIPLTVIGMICKSHRCLSCGIRFDWPPSWLRKFRAMCPACGESIPNLTEDCIDEKAACPRCDHLFTIHAPTDPQGPPPLP